MAPTPSPCPFRPFAQAHGVRCPSHVHWTCSRRRRQHLTPLKGRGFASSAYSGLADRTAQPRAKTPSRTRSFPRARITSRRAEKAGFGDIPLQFLSLGALFGGPRPDQAEGRLCVHSALHQRDTATGRPDRLWCPPRKAIRPAVPFSTCSPGCGRVAAQGIFLPFSGYKRRENGGRATKVYSAALVLNGVLPLFALTKFRRDKSPKRLPPFQE